MGMGEMTVYTLYRYIVSFNDTRTCLPLKVYMREEDAANALQEIKEEYGALFAPETIIKAGPHTIGLSNFLMELGIRTVSHNIAKHEVHESHIIQPRRGLVIAH